jgi:hypothetical protein
VTAIPAGFATLSFVFKVFPLVPAAWWLPFVIAREKLARVPNFIEGKATRYACKYG